MTVAGQPAATLPDVADKEITCGACGHTERWDHGHYGGEKTDFAHHVCGHPGTYRPCGPDCAHDFPDCASFLVHPAHPEHPVHADWARPKPSAGPLDWDTVPLRLYEDDEPSEP